MGFQSLKIIQPILNALEKEGYTVPTPIQEKAIPLLLDKKDVIGIAQTGTGKTAAFVVPILQKLHEKAGNSRARNPKALILVPTRELAAQISESFQNYGAFLNLKSLVVYGGVGIGAQIRELQQGIDILIATPGRLLDLMQQRKVNLEEIEFFVLDEADRMLDMGFVRDIKKIASALPREKQSLLFSATMSNEVLELTRKFLKDPIRMEIAPQATPIEKIKQCIFFIDSENKIELLLELINEQKMSCILIFVKTKHKADKLARMLNQNKIRADSIHGDKSQHHRMRALEDFKTGKILALVATDVAARGLDIDNISHVVNYDLPNEPENYVHRIGRTARAGAEGTAYSFCSAEERNYLNQIERITKTKTPHAEHRYHSTKAKNATGPQAKPKLRSGSGRSRPNRFGSNRPRLGQGSSMSGPVPRSRRKRAGSRGQHSGQHSSQHSSSHSNYNNRGRNDNKSRDNQSRFSGNRESRDRGNRSSENRYHQSKDNRNKNSQGSGNPRFSQRRFGSSSNKSRPQRSTSNRGRFRKTRDKR